jgi:hypothetical protein
VIRTLLYFLLMAGPVMAGNIILPSCLRATLEETIYEPQGVVATSAKTMRLRFLAPEIANHSGTDSGIHDEDFVWLCETSGLPLTQKAAPMVEQIIVSVSSEIVAFGETAPNVVQYFDAFVVEKSRCIWEGL